MNNKTHFTVPYFYDLERVSLLYFKMNNVLFIFQSWVLFGNNIRGSIYLGGSYKRNVLNKYITYGQCDFQTYFYEIHCLRTKRHHGLRDLEL